MRKFKYILYVILALFIGYIIKELIWGHHESISKDLEIRIPIFAHIDYQDMRGGFQYDGEVLARIYLTDTQVHKLVKDIQRNSHWKESPMENKLAVRITDFSNDFYRVIPTLENGYWFFKNNNSQSNNEYDIAEFWSENKFGYHFSVGVLDKNTNILYYYLYDA